MSVVFDVAVSTDWTSTRTRWADRDGTICGQFQTQSWLDAWYSSHAEAFEPLLVDVSQAGVLAARMAFAVSRRGALRVLEFADDGVSDFNAPILGPASPIDAVEAGRLWRAVTKVLPAIDLVDLRKMPTSVGTRANPLAMLEGGVTSPMTGHLVDVPDWDAYHAGLDRRVRMEFERCWRVMQRSPDVRFVRLREANEATRILDVMDRQQRARLTDVGQDFELDSPARTALYRHALAERLASGDVMVTAILSGTDVVATAYAVCDGRIPAILRISNSGGEWAKASPGRLMVYKTLQHLSEQGFGRVDLSVGDYDYKRRFSPTKTPLTDFVAAVSWRGRASALRHRAVSRVRQYPQIEVRLRRLLGRPDPATGRIPEIK